MYRPKSNVRSRISAPPGRPQTGSIKMRLGIKPLRKAKTTNTSPKVFGTVTDARNKLIEKKRQKFSDARERLAELAKLEDARVKLNKLKFNNLSQAKATANITQKKFAFRSGGIGNVRKEVVPLTRAGLRGRGTMKGGALMRNVAGSPTKSGFWKMTNRSQMTAAKANNSERFHPLKNNPNVVTIRNPKALQQKNPQRNRSSNSSFKTKRSFASQPHHQQQMLKPISGVPVYSAFEGPIWVAEPQPIQVPLQVQPTQLRITAPNTPMAYYPVAASQFETSGSASQFVAPPPPRSSAVKRSYSSHEPYSLPKKSAASLSSGMISRLDQTQLKQGSKVMVSNLHYLVTLEDIEELFGNIGTLSHARIIKEGVAEVTFIDEDDAYRSVEVYNNRQLDGQPMNVSVCGRGGNSSGRNERYSPHPRSPDSLPSTSSRTMRHSTNSILRSAGGSSNPANIFGKRGQHLNVSPDIPTIHEALFSGRGFGVPTNQQFYVKLPKQSVRGVK